MLYICSRCKYIHMYMCNYMLYCIYNFFLWKQAPGSTVSTAFARPSPVTSIISASWVYTIFPITCLLKCSPTYQSNNLATYILTYENHRKPPVLLLALFCKQRIQVWYMLQAAEVFLQNKIPGLERILFSSSDSRSPGGRCWLLVHANTHTHIHIYIYL